LPSTGTKQVSPNFNSCSDGVLDAAIQNIPFDTTKIKDITGIFHRRNVLY